MGFLDSVKSFLGVGESGSGGSGDAFENFKRYAEYIGQNSAGYLDALRGRGYNPYTHTLETPFQGLDQAIQQSTARTTGRLRQLSGQLPQQLRNSALASTQGAQVGAVNAARIASGGRGGLAFGGGASAIAARAGRNAAVQQSAALANALTQSTQMQLGAEQAAGALEQQALGQRAGLAQAIARARGMQGQMMDQWDLAVAGHEQAQSRGLYGLAAGGLHGGLTGDRTRQERKSGNYSHNSSSVVRANNGFS